MRRREILALPLLPWFMSAAPAIAAGRGVRKNHARAIAVAKRVLPKMRDEMAKKDLAPGHPVYLRFFKESSQLEMWVKPPGDARWKLFKNWKIARWSGTLGPKIAMGDGQTPEGFYHTDLESLNPESRFHLSFDINYPNAWDRAHDRTGNLIMVHGSNLSVGCYAMTDPSIEEIYTLVVMAIGAGQTRVPIHCFPFPMTDARLTKAEKREAEAPHIPFWRELQSAWKIFEESRKLPEVTVKDQHYVIRAV